MFLYSPLIGLLWQLTYLTTNSTQIFFFPWFPWPWSFCFFFYLFRVILWLLLYLGLNLPQNYFKYHSLLIYHFFFLFYSLSFVWFLDDLLNWSLPGSTVHGISQAKLLEWVAISFYRRSSWSRERIYISCIGSWILYHWTTRENRYWQWGFPGGSTVKN